MNWREIRNLNLMREREQKACHWYSSVLVGFTLQYSSLYLTDDTPLVPNYSRQSVSLDPFQCVVQWLISLRYNWCNFIMQIALSRLSAITKHIIFNAKYASQKLQSKEGVPMMGFPSLLREGFNIKNYLHLIFQKSM